MRIKQHSSYFINLSSHCKFFITTLLLTCFASLPTSLSLFFPLSHLGRSDCCGYGGDWGRRCRRGCCIAGRAGDSAGDAGYLGGLRVVAWGQLQVILPLSSHAVAVWCSVVPSYINPASRKSYLWCNLIFMYNLRQKLHNNPYNNYQLSRKCCDDFYLTPTE